MNIKSMNSIPINEVDKESVNTMHMWGYFHTTGPNSDLQFTSSTYFRSYKTGIWPYHI